ncbi:MAG TPA: hypothetical protein VKD67_13135 [Acidimicrobiales bacterium]|nr:hypothetical protein [Acidimicrobiales bacterium]
MIVGMKGRRIIQVDLVGTALFTVVSVVEVVVMAWMRPVGVALDLGLFAIGCATFLGAYALALNRSRTDEIGVASLYFLTNNVAPKPVRNRMWAAFAAQCAVAVTAASVRPFTTAAFSVLVPMFGLGLNGLWAARHGTFGARIVPSAPTEETSEDGSDSEAETEMEQNASHG